MAPRICYSLQKYIPLPNISSSLNALNLSNLILSRFISHAVLYSLELKFYPQQKPTILTVFSANLDLLILIFFCYLTLFNKSDAGSSFASCSTNSPLKGGKFKKLQI